MSDNTDIHWVAEQPESQTFDRKSVKHKKNRIADGKI